MKIYELGFRNGDNADEDSFTLWIATNRPIRSPSALYCKEIDLHLDTDSPGIDLFID